MSAALQHNQELETLEAELARRDFAEIEAISAELAERSLREYIKQAWDQVEPGRRLLWNWHIDVIADHLEAIYDGDIRKLLINIPPRFAKSLIVCVFFMTWVWLKDPKKRWMFSSYSLTFSKRDSGRCRKLILSKWYQSRWGDRFTFSPDQNEKMRFDNDKAGFRIATSTDGPSTGEGADIKVTDDPHKPSEIHSDTTREKDLRWWRETWSSRLNDEKTGADVVVMQRLDDRDLSGYLLKQEGDWEHVCLPLEAELGTKRVTSIAPLGYDPRKEEGELLFESRVGAKEVAAIKKRSGSNGYAAQYQQRPNSKKGDLFKRDHWRFWKPADAAGVGTAPRPEGCNKGLAVVLPVLEKVVISLDATFKDKSTSDFVSFTVWGAAKADRFLLDREKGRWSFTETVKQLKNLVKRYPRAYAKLVEDKANGSAILDTLKGEISGLIAVEPRGGKYARAAAVQPQCESGNVYLPEGAAFLDEYVEELAAFPNAPHDDDVDSTSQGLLHLMSASSGLWS